MLVHGQRGDAEALREVTARVLEPLGLRLSPAKTSIVHMSEAFEFLGFRIQWRRKQGTSKWYPCTFIAARSVRAVKAKIRAHAQDNAERPGIRADQHQHGLARVGQLLQARHRTARLRHAGQLHMAKSDPHAARNGTTGDGRTSAAGSPPPPGGGCRSRRARLNCGQSRPSRLPGTATAAARSPIPGQLNQPDDRNRGEPVAPRGARRVR